MPSPTLSKQALLLVSLLLGGCSISPSLVLFGAAFPDWLFCIVGGILGVTIIHLFLGLYNAHERFSPLALSYPALTSLLVTLLWLAVFHQ
ncbi:MULTISPECIES: YtcA family lipoprotein [Pseudomonas]|uniref:YtcA family lipoprotein n=1 Tax=Pseudomonas TaxID=286 RepID=UPI0009B89AB1|nr:hypothetical protein F7R16_21760 [Pseudomonas chlororaphis subsp. aureofaciens]TSD31293.1 hypothetical protein FCE86_017520 [Pseudomonas sp. ATCC 13985]